MQTQSVLVENNIKIYIPTYRRVNNQITYSSLPSWLQPKVVFVVDKQDFQSFSETEGLYYEEQFLVRPEYIKGIAQKRAWLIANCREEKMIMMDDDLSFEVRDGAPGKTKVATPEDVGYWLMELWKKLNTYAHVGFSVRRHNDKLPVGWFENSRMQCVLGYRPEVMREECSLGRIETREDFDYTLQLLQRGYPNAICAEILFSQTINATGGISTYRTVESSNAEALQLEEFHPGIVRAVDRKYKTQKSEFGTRKEVICYWKKAYDLGIKNHGRRMICSGNEDAA